MTIGSKGDVSLSWNGGYFRGTKNDVAPKGNDVVETVFGFDLEKKKASATSRVGDIQALFGNDSGQEMDVDVLSDIEWFYTVSLSRTFAAESGAIGRSFSSGAYVWLTGSEELLLYECERVKEARVHGIQTLVCIATPNGVLELGSSDLIKEDWSLVQLAKSLLGSSGAPIKNITPNIIQRQNSIQNQISNIRDSFPLLLDIGIMPSGSGRNESILEDPNKQPENIAKKHVVTGNYLYKKVDI